jgi:AdoMet-dependent heme synthase
VSLASPPASPSPGPEVRFRWLDALWVQVTGTLCNISFLQGLGIRQPRVKFLPLLRIGREQRRTHGHLERDALDDGALAPLAPEVEATLLCASGRCVTAQGVYTCPILVERAGARLGESLAGAARPIRLGFDACRTCVQDGLRCNT